MDTSAVSDKIKVVNEKIDENKKPIQYVVIGGIILAIIVFFLMLFMLFRLIFGFGLYLAKSIGENNRNTAAANASLNTDGRESRSRSGGSFFAPRIPTPREVLGEKPTGTSTELRY
jgi:hypothetical protein